MIDIDSKKDTEKIIYFIQGVLKKTESKDVVVGWSGGIDSTVCLYLLARALSPQNIHALHMPYIHSSINELTDSRIHGLKIHEISIKKAVDNLWKTVEGNFSLDSRLRGNDKQNRGNDPTSPRLRGASLGEKVRLGNIMARVRMIMLFDYAKK